MSSKPIEPNVHAYGTHAQGSVLADWLELLALGGTRLSKATLRDYLQDTSWNAEEFYTDDYGTSDIPDEPADRAFKLIRERDKALGQYYPFMVNASTDRIELRTKRTKAILTPYVSLLCLTVAHAYGLAVRVAPIEAFEDLVTLVLGEHGLKAIGFGAMRRRNRNIKRNFKKTLELAASEIGLPANTLKAPRSKRAQDAGVDTLCHLPWKDTRIGRLLVIGQTTCGKSESWEKKIYDPSPELWKEYLGERVNPTVFLAVPHHVEPFHFTYLVSHSSRMVIDRLRLAAYNSVRTKEVIKLTGEVLAMPVMKP